jgi:hypothetical protein
MIIGIVGFLGSGKGTVGDILIQNYGFYRLSFADAVKDAVSVIFSWPRHLLEGDTQESREFREKPDAFWSKRFGYEVTPRYMLQLMGTEAGRDVFHKDIWIHALERKLAMFDNVVVPDVRFPNEIDFIRKVGGKIVRVKRGPEPDWYDLAHAANNVNFLHSPECHDEMSKSGIHYSEWAWVGQDFDHVIDNDGSMEDLRNKINNIMES